MKTSVGATEVPGTTTNGPESVPAAGDPLLRALGRIGRPAWVVQRDGALEIRDDAPPRREGSRAAFLPPMRLEDLGDRSFTADHGLRLPCVSGAMANGIGSVEVVEAMSRAGMLGFFGSAGLEPAVVAAAVDRLKTDLGAAPFGVNFIHSPGEPDLEEALVDLFLAKGMRLAEASAFLDLTPALVRFRLSGLRAGPDGRPLPRNRVLAKVSRVEVATKFLSPAPERIVRELAAAGRITAEEARLAARIPVAQDLTVEADSGGHTDNRPLVALFPTIRALQDEISRTQRYARPIRIGAAGGLGTPASLAAAYALGAAYVLTGTVNQAAVESGLSADGKKLLATAEVSDVIMAPAADMFELGVKLQVLRRGTMFAVRAQRLYDAWLAYPSLEAIPAEVRQKLEKEVFGTTMDAVWDDTRRFFERRDPPQVERAEKDPKHRLALVCRWYLGKSSRWAIEGDPARKLDYQIWCGPAMGAFNAWVKGSFLEPPEARGVVPIALNLLEGAAVITRAQQLRTYGVPVPPAAFDFRPRPLVLG